MIVETKIEQLGVKLLEKTRKELAALPREVKKPASALLSAMRAISTPEVELLFSKIPNKQGMPNRKRLVSETRRQGEHFELVQQAVLYSLNQLGPDLLPETLKKAVTLQAAQDEQYRKETVALQQAREALTESIKTLEDDLGYKTYTVRGSWMESKSSYRRCHGRMTVRARSAEDAMEMGEKLDSDSFDTTWEDDWEHDRDNDGVVVCDDAKEVQGE